MARAFLALGSNLGDRREQLRRALAALGRHGVQVLGASSLYESAPMYVTDQPAFLNAVIEAETELSPEALLAAAKSVERELGRQERFRNGPREVDVDLLTYGDERRDTAELTLPHPRMAERPFVRVPLAELAGTTPADEPGLRCTEGPDWATPPCPSETADGPPRAQPVPGRRASTEQRSSQNMRVFVAVDVGAEVRQRMAAVQERLHEAAPGMKWVRPELSHITLQFLGNVPSGRIPAIEAACRQAVDQAAAFELGFHGMGAFPDWRRPRVLWIGVASRDGSLARLQEAVAQQLAAASFEGEERSFTPHLTLGRFRLPPPRPVAERLHAAAAAYAERDFGRVQVASVQLMQSLLGRGGPAYTVLSSWPLAAAPSASR